MPRNNRPQSMSSSQRNRSAARKKKISQANRAVAKTDNDHFADRKKMKEALGVVDQTTKDTNNVVKQIASSMLKFQQDVNAHLLLTKEAEHGDASKQLNFGADDATASTSSSGGVGRSASSSAGSVVGSGTSKKRKVSKVAVFRRSRRLKTSNERVRERKSEAEAIFHARLEKGRAEKTEE